MRPGDVKGLWKAAVAFAGRVAAAIIGPEMETKGHVVLFIDATGTEMDGQFFQWARKDCNGNRGYRLHVSLVKSPVCVAVTALRFRTTTKDRNGMPVRIAGFARCVLHEPEGCDLREFRRQDTGMAKAFHESTGTSACREREVGAHSFPLRAWTERSVRHDRECLWP